MDKKIYNIYFSPTGGTKEVVRFVGGQFGEGADIDLSAEVPAFELPEDALCIVGVPSFGGRAPQIAMERLRQLTGHSTPAVPVVTYGNRAYEDTLREMKDVLEEQGFVCVGAAAVITHHSIMTPYGLGRPNQTDLDGLRAFTAQVKERLQTEAKSVDVPGNVPYKELKVIPMKIETKETCVKCGLCAKLCPVHAISPEHPEKTDAEKCISCMRCVAVCPQQAKSVDAAKVAQMIEKMKPVCSVEKECDFF